jgi:hypothetical protein
VKFAAKAHLTDRTLRDARVANLFTFLVGLKLLDSEFTDRLAIPANSLVNPSIGTRADEANDAVTICNSNFGLIPG